MNIWFVYVYAVLAVALAVAVAWLAVGLYLLARDMRRERLARQKYLVAKAEVLREELQRLAAEATARIEAER